MAEEIKFDLLGERALRFDAFALTYITRKMGVVPLPGVIAFVRFVKNEPLPYGEIRWIGRVHRRQWWAVVLAGTLGLLGLLWIFWGLRDGETTMIVVGVIWFLLWGVWPAWIFIRGRYFLLIATGHKAICFPMDRRRAKIRRTIELLRQHCPPEKTHWEMIESPFGPRY